MLGRWLFLIGMMAAPLSWAGQMTLKTGEVVTGTLKGIKDDKVLWASEELGSLTVNKSAIKAIVSIDKLKVRGTKVPCTVKSLRGSKLNFECENGTLPSFPFMSLVHVIPFEGHKEGNHAYKGSLRASGWQQSGNTESEYWEMLTSVTFRHSDFRHVLSATLDGQKNESNADDGKRILTRKRHRVGVYSLDWFFRPQLYWSNKLSAEADDDRNIQEEYILGSGLGYQFWENTTSAFSLELGLEYSRTYLKENPLSDEPEKFTSGSLGMRYRYKFQNGLSVYHNNQLVHSLQGRDAGKATRWKAGTDTGVQFPIGFGISASLSMKWDYVNYAEDLDPNSSKRDTTFRAGINYAW